MAGIENITNTIRSEAEAESKEILQKYEAQADAVLKEAQAERESMLEKAKTKIAAEKVGAIKRAESSAQLKKRQAILSAKQEIIAELIQKAYKAILIMEDSSYFELLLKMMAKHMEEGKDGEIYFSEKDLARMPADFEKKIKEIAVNKKSSIELVKEPKPLDGGFILVYGGIEENCSIEAMINAEKEEIGDALNRLLFSDK